MSKIVYEKVLQWGMGPRIFGGSKWRNISRRVILCLLRNIQVNDERDLRRVLRFGYPFGERRYWPYRVWLSERKKTLAMYRTMGGIEEELPLWTKKTTH